MAKEMTRKELYTLVWANPMTKVAAELGISDVALHKICDKHRVPSPGRGYWAKVAAGKPVKRTLFREISDPFLNHIRIDGSALASLPEEVLKAREEAKAAAAMRKQAMRPLAQPIADAEFHPLIGKLKQRLETKKAESDGFIHFKAAGYFPLIIAPESASRAVAIIDTLLKEAEAVGHTFSKGENGLNLVISDEQMSIELSEQTDRVRHDLTEKELASLRKWEADREGKVLRNQWYGDWDKPKFSEWDHVPNGRLTIQIDPGPHWDGLRRKFADGQRQRLEELIPAVITAAATLSAARKAKRAEDERRRIESEERERQRQEQERKERLEAKRLEFLTHQMEYMDEALKIDDFVEKYLAIYPEDQISETSQKFIGWCRRRSATVKHHIRPEQLNARLEKYHIMNDEADIPAWTDIKRDW